MANKDEYFLRIIASLQSEITSLKTGQSEAMKEIKALKSNVARQQKEIEALKASQGAPQKSLESQQKWITTENLLLSVKRVCDDIILTHYEQLPTWFTDRQEFESYCKSSEQKFLSVDTFTAYQKSEESRLKSIEEKLGSHYSLLTINRYDKDCNRESKSYINFDTIIRAFKNGNYRWLWATIVSISISLFAVFLISSITT